MSVLDTLIAGVAAFGGMFLLFLVVILAAFVESVNEKARDENPEVHE